MKKKYSHIIVVFVLIAIGVVALYYFFLTHNFDKEEDLTEKKTFVEKMIDMDLDIYYPATTNTVLETYGKICQALYNEDYTDEQYKKLMSQYRKLMDDELLLKNPEEAQLTSMREEIADYKEKDKNIFTYRFVDDLNNKEVEIGDKTYATITMSFGVKEGSSIVVTTEETFILRKDNEDKWKILGWKLREKKDDSLSASANPSASPTAEE